MKKTAIFLTAMAVSVAAWAGGPDLNGKWNSEFDTQIGHLKYVYDLKVDGDKVTGKALRDQEGQKAETEITDGKIKGDEVSFVEPLKFQDNTLKIEYKGKIAGDELKLHRKVGDFGETDIVAKREKKTEAPAKSEAPAAKK